MAQPGRPLGNQIVRTMTERESLAATLVCKRLRANKARTIAQSIWLSDRWATL